MGGPRPSDELYSLIGGGAVRLDIDWTLAVWPNILDLRVDDADCVVQVGDLFRVLYYYLDVDSNSTTTFFLDEDRNPYNGNAHQTDQRFEQRTGETLFTDGQFMCIDTVSPGAYYVSARIADAGGRSRWAYAPQAVTLIPNPPPEIVSLSTNPPFLDETQTTTLSCAFEDESTNDSHTVAIDWGDGTDVESFDLPTGARAFSRPHQYADDRPSGTAQDVTVIQVRVTDNPGGRDEDGTIIAVNNVTPSLAGIILDRPRGNENESLIVSGTITDPASEDTHSVIVNWGDGRSDTWDLVKGDRSFSKSHHYLDDNPSGTPEDKYTITVTVRDDDTGSDDKTTTVTVVNVAPEIVKNLYQVNEGGSVSFGDCYMDPGSQDTHTVTPASRSFLDDDPTGTTWDEYRIPVTVTDDDTGTDTEDIVVRVNNVAPQVNLPGTWEINEGTVFVYSGSFTDPGTDTWQGWVDYADGGGWQDLPLDGGAKSFRLEHDYYHDDGQYTVKVRVRDDDTGENTAQMLLTVKNVAPVVRLESDSLPNEGAEWRVTVYSQDPGLDEWTVTIDWGDGSLRDIQPVFDPTFLIKHIYADNGTYPLTVTVVDDDEGVGSAELAVTVQNVDPGLWIKGRRTVDEGAEFSVTDIGMFTDPGFDNPVNPFYQPGGSHETFTGHINWGDGSEDHPPGTVDSPGGPGKLTRGTFDGRHTYADNGPIADNFRYRAKLWATDDDEGPSIGRWMTIVVNNVAPQISDVRLAASEINEGGVARLTVTFVDPGLPDLHTARVDWGDGSAVDEFLIVPVGTRTLTREYRYEDDNPSGTPSDLYTITVTIVDDDGGVSGPETRVIRVSNVAPAVIATATTPALEGSVVTLAVDVADPGIRDTFWIDVAWGDGTSEPPRAPSTNRTYTFTHVYADNGAYPVGVRVTDDDTGVGEANASVTVVNVAPVVTSLTVDSPVWEGAVVNLLGIFKDKGTLDTHTAEVDWGDNEPPAPGVVNETPFGPPGSVEGMTGTVSASHVYADNGTYRVKLTVRDDDGESHFLFADVVVNNVEPTLSVPGSQTTDEGLIFELASTFTDPGFSKLSAGTTETFSYRIEWGDESLLEDEVEVTDVQNGQPGTPTRGTFVGRHVYADNGSYTVTAKVRDDDMPAGTWVERMVAVTVRNVAPTVVLVGPGSVTGDEGAQLAFQQVATFTDPGFTNPLAGTAETFTSRIDWGDGKFDDWRPFTDVQQGRPGVPTQGSFGGSHIYADNGTYTVRVAVRDDDGDEGFQTFQAVVGNVAPTLWVIGNQPATAGVRLVLTDIGAFIDPGFANPSNPGSERDETFRYSINWGDETAPDTGDAFIDQFGSPGIPTAGSFDGNHTYANAGLYVVKVRVDDDDLGYEEVEFEVFVSGASGFQFLMYEDEPSSPEFDWSAAGLLGVAQAADSPGERTFSLQGLEAAGENAAPTLWVIGNQQFDKGNVSIVDIGTFYDPDSVGPFTYRIDWGDGTGADTGTATIDLPGPPTYGSFDGEHGYTSSGTHWVGVTITDNEGGSSTEEFDVAVVTPLPKASIIGAPDHSPEGTPIALHALMTGPGSEGVFTYGWTVTKNGQPYNGTGSEAAFAFTPDDNATYLVTLAATAQDGTPSPLASATITVDNFAPTAKLWNSGAVDEGRTANVAFSDQLDPSTADTAAGFHYAYDFNNDGTFDVGDGTYAGSPGTSAVVVPAIYVDDNPSRTVRARILDKDNEFHEYFTVIEVRNVAPTARLASISGCVYADTNRNGGMGLGEELPGVLVTLYRQDGAGNWVTVASQATDDNAWYRFNDLPGGTYQVVEAHPKACLPGGPESMVVNLQGAEDQRVDFWDLGFCTQHISKQFMLASRLPVGSPAWRQLVRQIISQAGATSLAPGPLQGTPAPTAPVGAQAIMVAPDGATPPHPDPLPPGERGAVVAPAANLAHANALPPGERGVLSRPAARARRQQTRVSTAASPVAPTTIAPPSIQTPKAANNAPRQVTQKEVQPIVDQAIARWSAAGLDPRLVEKMRQTEVVVADLPGVYLGMADSHVLYLDQDAAGRGWFVDPTPAVDEEFRAIGLAGELRAVDAAALDQMDLLTVVEHELGHAAGLADLDASASALMSRSLGRGVRRVAGTREIDALFAANMFRGGSEG